MENSSVTYNETLKARVSNALKLLSGLKGCNILLTENNIEGFFETQAQLKSLFDTEESLAKKMEGFNIENATGELEKNKNQLIETLQSANKLVEKNKEQLGRMMESILKEHNKSEAIGNVASKYYTPPEIIPKFIDLKS